MIQLPCVLASSLALAAAAAAAAIEAFDEPGEDATVGSAPDALVPSFPAVSIAGDRWIDRLDGHPDQGGRDTNELEHLAAAIVLVKGERDTVDDEG